MDSALEMVEAAYMMGLSDGAEGRRKNPNVEAELRYLYEKGYERGRRSKAKPKTAEGAGDG